MTYAIFLRKSRSDIELESREKMETLAKHEQILTQLAQRQGLNITEIYREVISGDTLEQRPEMRRLIKDLYQRKYKGVLVMSIDRLARGNAKDQGIISEAFKVTSTLIVTPQKTYDPNNMSDEDFIDFGLFMARFEYKAITRRMTIGKLQAIMNGNFMGSRPPYGFDVDKRGKNDRVLVANDKADIVRMIFNWYTNDRLSAGEIARRLTAMGEPSPSGRNEWGRATIKEIVRNEHYAGKVVWQHRKTTSEYEDSAEKVVKKKRRQKEAMVFDGRHDGIITDDQFLVARSLSGQPPKNTGKKLINPLAGILKCKKCGKVMIMQTFKDGRARPRIGHRDNTLCKVKSTIFDDVYLAIINALEAKLDNFEFMLTNDYEIQKAKENERVLKAMRRELEELEEQQEELYNLLEKKIYDEKTFMKRNGKLQPKIDDLEMRIKGFRQVETVDYTERVVKLKDVIEALKDEDIDALHKNNLLKEAVERIDYSVVDGEVLLEVY